MTSKIIPVVSKICTPFTLTFARTFQLTILSLLGLMLSNFQQLSFASGFSNSLSNKQEHTENSAGELILKNQQGKVVSTLLLDTEISADVNGLIATIKMRQTFRNNSDDWVNGRYVFPLPENGAVDGMTMQIGDRIIKGKIKEKQAAKKIFEAAKKAGKKASLLEQHRPNLFSMSVANIPPRGELIAEIHIIDRVKYDQHIFSLRLPTTLTPRYIPGKALKLNIQENKNVLINQHSGWGVNTDSVPDATDITPPQIHAKDTQTPNDFSLKLTLNAGIKLDRIHSETHELLIQNQSTKPSISLKNQTALMNRDLVLQWHPIKTQAPTAALFQQQIDGEQYSMAMLLPPTANIQNALAREITFIIDSSGSMSGDSMKKAKKSLLYALDKLSDKDRFNIVDFDNRFTPFFSTPVQANQANIHRAKTRVHLLRADGGTEMFGPLDYVLSLPSDESLLKQVIFITDGSVGNEQQLFKLINDKLGSARLFTVGIGSAPNSHFMSKAAQFGRGSFTHIDSFNESTEKMNALFNKINRPIARDLSINYSDSHDTKIEAHSFEQYPKKIPDLYSGEPIMVLTKSDNSINSIEISGNLLGNHWKRSLSSSTQAQSTDNIDALWARKKVSHLMDQLYTNHTVEMLIKPQVIELGIKHHLLTKYTSFVAVEEIPSKPIDATTKNKNIPNLMPKGSAMKAPQTATSAGLLSFIGSIMMFFAMLIGSQGFRLSLFGWMIRSKEEETYNEYQA